MNGFGIFQFGCVNVNSLMSKLLYVRYIIRGFDLTIAAVYETWLVPLISLSFVAIDGFQVVHGDDRILSENMDVVCMLQIFCLLFLLKLGCLMLLLCFLLIWIFAASWVQSVTRRQLTVRTSLLY